MRSWAGRSVRWLRGGGRRAALRLAPLILAFAAMAPEAQAGEGSTAKSLFIEATQLMKMGKHAEACPKLEESRRLEPRLATGFRLAECYASVARPASAWSLFSEVAAGAERKATTASDPGTRDVYQDLAREAGARAAELEPTLPRITIQVASEAAGLSGLEVRLDGGLVEGSRWGEDIPVDIGEHTVSAAATGRAPWSARVRLNTEGSSILVRVPFLEETKLPAPPNPPPDDPTAYLLVGALAFSGAIAGTVAGLRASEKYEMARSKCPSGCGENTFLLKVAQEHTEEARVAATVSTVAFATSGAALAGLLIYGFWPDARKTPQHASVRIGAGPRGDGAGLLLVGSF